MSYYLLSGGLKHPSFSSFLQKSAGKKVRFSFLKILTHFNILQSVQTGNVTWNNRQKNSMQANLLLMILRNRRKYKTEDKSKHKYVKQQCFIVTLFHMARCWLRILNTTAPFMHHDFRWYTDPRSKTFVVLYIRWQL